MISSKPMDFETPCSKWSTPCAVPIQLLPAWLSGNPEDQRKEPFRNRFVRNSSALGERVSQAVPLNTFSQPSAPSWIEVTTSPAATPPEYWTCHARDHLPRSSRATSEPE